MKKKLILSLIIFVSLVIINSLRIGIEPTISAEVALNNLNGGEIEAVTSRMYNSSYIFGTLLQFSILLSGVWVVINIWKINMQKNNVVSMFWVLVLAISSLTMSGCGFIKPFDVPEFIEIESNETAFVVPLEGDIGKQEKFESVEQLQAQKIATKRVQIPHRWNKTGRFPASGEWIDTIRVIRVDRTPVTRQWSADSAEKNQPDTAIWVESKDSVGFSTGFSCSAYVREEDAAKFLYWYPSKSLGEVMDKEIRARIQKNVAEVAAKFELDELRGKKQDIISEVRTDITSFFSERGITITIIGMFGGMTYENADIQKSIDEVVIAQQQKNVAEAETEAQIEKNKKIQLEATAQAERLTTEAEGKAQAISLISKATMEAQQNPLFLNLRQLETTEKLIEKWNGTYPTYFMGSEETNPSSLLLQLPQQ